MRLNKLKFFTFFNIRVLLILIIPIFIGSYLRFPGVLSNSFAFTYDVGRDLLAVEKIVHFEKISLIGFTTGLPGVFYGPWWYLFLVPFFLISSGNPQGIAFFMALFGILAIPLGFYLGRKLDNNFLAFSIAILVAVSPVLVSFSSQIWNPYISIPLVFAVLIILKRIYSLSKTNSIYYLFLGLLLAFIVDLEIVFGILLTAGIVFSIPFTKNKKIKLKNILFFLFGYIFILSPRIIFEFKHNFLMSKSLLIFLTKGEEKTSFAFFEIVVNRINIFFDQFNQTFGLENKLIGFILVLFITASISLKYKKTSNEIKNFVKTSIVVLVIFLLGAVLFRHDFWPHYIVGLPVFYIMLLAIALTLISDNIRGKILAILILLSIFLVSINPVDLVSGIGKPVWEGDAAVYRNQLAVIDYVYEEARGKNFKYVVYTPPVNDYTYQYLFNWRGIDKYGYLPSVKSKLAYFILEPDHENPLRLTNWIEERQGDGKVTKSQKLKGGIIVQTRIN